MRQCFNYRLYRLAALCLFAVIFTSAASNEVKINNITGEDIYIALVMSRNFGHSYLIYDPNGRTEVRRLGMQNGPLKPLKDGYWVTIENFPEADKKDGMPKYDRALWVSNDAKALAFAIEKGNTSSSNFATESKVRSGTIRSNTTATISKIKGKYKIDTSKEADHSASLKGKNAFDNIAILYPSQSKKNEG